ncbi:FAD binding domain-containing protein [Pseudomonas migulae]|uniref:2-polyprenyl-6-methoxyphenol hydroxylase n=1 Tax=Pseudomonas migulae TaxID=78543 RepID=A0A1H5L0I5_9PSED|nr:FAD binding domain-containing protein [Pseudomonas migulae]SEE69841.1 2-polyprenyl-6-methoxyphenol hydroxylase [Pseudomonas migulae]
MKSPDVPKALVIGGSLGGLFAATALRAIGWHVDIFERSPAAMDSRGGGIVLQADVLQHFRYAGIDHANALGVRSHDRLYLDRAGTVVHKEPMPQTQTSWNTLYNALFSAFPAEHYHRGKTLVDLIENEQRVTAIFEDGSRVEGDLLIGADGAGSTVRSLVLPGTGYSYSGYVVWRGLVDEHRLPDFAQAQIYEDFVFQQDPESLMLEYMVPGLNGSVNPGERRFNWLWYLKAAQGPELDAVLTDKNGHRLSHSVPPGALAVEQDAYIRERGEQHANPAFRELIRQTKDIFVQAILDLNVPRMVFGRVLLTGDAAFVPRPHTAGSTAKAARNALALAQAIEDIGDIDKALLAWQRLQLAEGKRMGDWGVSMGNRIMGIS